MENKVLKAFGRITSHIEYDNDSSYDCLNFEDDCKLVEDALQELDGIKNSKPNDAMKYLEVIGSVCPEEDVSAAEIFYEEYGTIKQYILKAKENEKILSTIKAKRIDIESFYTMFVECNLDYDYYETFYENFGLQQLTEEEFGTLKRWANND